MDGRGPTCRVRVNDRSFVAKPPVIGSVTRRICAPKSKITAALAGPTSRWWSPRTTATRVPPPPPGRLQSTSLVNGLYYAESLGRLMQTEFNAFAWWDLRNGSETKGDFSASLYGWRAYGDFGIINRLGTKHPVFYAAKLLSHFAPPGSDVLAAEPGFSLLSAFAARLTNHCLSVLIINKDKTAIQGRIEWPASSLPADGKDRVLRHSMQDEAARTNGTAAKQDVNEPSRLLGKCPDQYLPPYRFRSPLGLPSRPAARPSLMRSKGRRGRPGNSHRSGRHLPGPDENQCHDGRVDRPGDATGTGASIAYPVTNHTTAQFFRVLLQTAAPWVLVTLCNRAGTSRGSGRHRPKPLMNNIERQTALRWHSPCPLAAYTLRKLLAFAVA